jgi:hypothetical protein
MSFTEMTLKEANKTCINFMLLDGDYHTAQELAHYAMIKESTDTCPITRDTIREMIDGGSLIGSTSKGYKLMTSGKEVQQCLNGLLKRQMGISRRIQSIYDAAQAKGIL